ncbi:Outer membrane protein beta-barrel domain-containing protein [Pontibacter chinhatensis]|uniref:Outer membrane protein beta-barrel domain-containing protein n=2 Tax=Pontibacter chinhatensis TaxID=1436961 RepID=A0A1I2Z897_9BACT|nr:Outer membrane protein beta-barrel domain-containing protein [Pontibacter chinhatensis]
MWPRVPHTLTYKSMKKLLLSLTIALASFTVAQAQSGLGVRGGANFSNLSGDLKDESRYENKVGFHGGLTYNIPVVGDFFSIQPELLYSNKGFKYEDTEVTLPVGGTFRREGNMNYNYLELPVLARIKAGPIYFEAGPQASYLLSVNNNIKEYMNGDRTSSATTEISKGDIKDFELGYAAGIGITSGMLSVGVRYNGSVTDFMDKSSTEFFDDENFTDARHSTIMLTLGLNFSASR